MDKYWRMQAHKEFDVIWKRKMKYKKWLWDWTRSDQYKKLADYLGVQEKDAHMWVMDKEMCLKVIEYSRKRKKQHMYS